MHIQPVKDSIEIHWLPALLHPLNHTGNKIYPETHAHQFLNQLIVGMAANELRVTWVSNHYTGARANLRRDISRRGVATLSKVGWLGRMMMCSPSFTIIIHHIRTAWRKRGMWPGRWIAISWWRSISSLDLLRRRLL